MDTIITDVLEILKDAEDSISWEERMRSYFAEYICNALGTAIERLDDEIVEKWKQEGWRVERRDKRTILTSFGQMTFLRRRMKKEGEAGCYPLDDAMGFRKYQRMTAYFEYLVAQVAAGATYRQTAAAVSTLTTNTISHQQVGNVIRAVGKRCEEQEDAQKEVADEGQQLREPEVLMIEGDGVTIRPQGTRNHLEIHRFQIAEGVRMNGKRRELVGTHYVASFSRQDAVDQMISYLGSHYDLSNTIVLSNSDGGSGYEKEVFDEIIGKALRHEHFRDRYHVNQKIKDRVGWAGKALNKALHKALRECDWERVCTVLDTIASKRRRRTTDGACGAAQGLPPAELGLPRQSRRTRARQVRRKPRDLRKQPSAVQLPHEETGAALGRKGRPGNDQDSDSAEERKSPKGHGCKRSHIPEAV